MPNAIASELIKLCKNKMAKIGTVIIVVIPFLWILKTLFLEPVHDEYMIWFGSVYLINMLVIPIVSGLVITSIVQKEYQDKTIRNILTAPTKRESFVISKLFVWLLWYLVSVFMAEMVIVIGALILYSGEFTANDLQFTLTLLTRTNLLSFIAMIPVFWITIMQQALFYPAMLAILGFTVLQVAGNQISEDFILPASMCPWTAVSISGMVGSGTHYWWICLLSIILCGLIGAIGAVITFKHQDQ